MSHGNLRYLCYDPYCDYEAEFDNVDEAKKFARLNACRCIDQLRCEVVCDYSNQEEEQ